MPQRVCVWECVGVYVCVCVARLSCGFIRNCYRRRRRCCRRRVAPVACAARALLHTKFDFYLSAGSTWGSPLAKPLAPSSTPPAFLLLLSGLLLCRRFYFSLPAAAAAICHFPFCCLHFAPLALAAALPRVLCYLRN